MARTRTSRHLRLITAGMGMAGIAAMLATAATVHADDTLFAAASSANPDDPAVFYYSADPTNIFSPVYTISPTGAEDVISTDGSGDIVGTQEFTVSYFGIPLDTFNGGVEYSPVSSPLDPFGSPYVEDVSTLGAAGTLIPDNTGFLTEEFGGGYGYLTDLANITGTSPTASEYILTPFGPENITNFVNDFLNLAGNATGTADATAADSTPDITPADLLSDASTNYTGAGQLLSDIPSSSVGEYAPALASQEEFDGNMVQGIANLDSAESALSSYGNGVLAEFLNPVFSNIDQSWDSASQSALDATQALDGVVGSGSTADIAAGFLAVSTSEFEALQPAIQAEFIDLGAHFLTGGDFTSFADLGAGLAPVTAIDPAMFADLLSSIGL